MVFSLEEEVEHVVVEVIGRIETIKYAHWKVGNFIWKIAIWISINNYYLIAFTMIIRLVLCKPSNPQISLINNTWIHHLNGFRWLKIYMIRAK